MCYTFYMKLICPKCGSTLFQKEKRFVCSSNHSYDIAKSGYVNLLLKQSKDHGDNKEMVQARTAFLEKDYYGFLKEELKQISIKESPSVLADLGCGEGYYTKEFVAKEKYGFDMAKDALTHAAKQDSSTQYAIASIFHLPLENDCCDMVVTCFAPTATLEIPRILKDHGCFVCVTPGPKHLFELKEQLYETPYLNKTDEIEWSLKKEAEYSISNSFHATNEDLEHLFQMTPYAYKTGRRGIEILHKITSLDLTAEFVIRIYRK